MHYTISIITKEKPTENLLEEILMPYCEDIEYISKENLAFDECSSGELEMYEGIYLKDSCIKDGVEIPFREYYKSFKDFMVNGEYFSFNEEENAFGNWYNPSARWDWWVVGGRWDNLLCTKNHQFCNSCQIKDIDWEKSSRVLPTYNLIIDEDWLDEESFSEDEFKKLLSEKTNWNDWITIIDYHV